MTPILHHYDLSMHSEKIRLAFGLKNMAWRSVETSAWPPRHGLEPLTAGYRRIPVLQVGSDIYCDTQLILDEIERLKPTPSLYPKHQRGLVSALSYWADTTLFLSTATLTTSFIDDIPQDLIKDRIALWNNDFSQAASQRELPKNRQRVQAQINVIADMLSDGRKFLLGNAVSAADLHAYYPFWFTVAKGGKNTEALLTLKPLKAWMARVAKLGYGKPVSITAEQALAEAKASKPRPTKGIPTNDSSGLKMMGQKVRVVSDEGGDPMHGYLVAANPRDIVISTTSASAGTVHVHFPRFGYSLLAEN